MAWHNGVVVLDSDPALRDSREPHDLAEQLEQLWVDILTLRTRMNMLDPTEVSELEYHSAATGHGCHSRPSNQDFQRIASNIS